MFFLYRKIKLNSSLLNSLKNREVIRKLLSPNIQSSFNKNMIIFLNSLIKENYIKDMEQNKFHKSKYLY